MAAKIDTLAMLRLFADTSHRFATKLGTSANPPKSVAKRLGIDAAHYLYTWSGGNMPQYLVNRFAERSARGEMRAARRAGGKARRTQRGVARRGPHTLSWHAGPGRG